MYVFDYFNNTFVTVHLYTHTYILYMAKKEVNKGQSCYLSLYGNVNISDHFEECLWLKCSTF